MAARLDGEGHPRAVPLNGRALQRRAGAAAVLAAALLATLAAAPTAGARRPALQIGIQDDALFVRGPQAYGWRAGELMPRSRAYRAARALSTRVLRINVLWKYVAGVKRGDPWDWSYYDAAVNSAIAHHVEPQLTLTGPAPGWATGDGKPEVFRPKPDAFAQFAATAAERYAGRVRRYSIWNEPNWPSWLAPQRAAPSIYRRLYLAGYAAIKRADPAAKVMIGELAPMGPPEAATPPLRFLRRLTCSDRRWHAVRRCAHLVTDGFAHHPYALRWAPWYAGPTRDDVTMGSLGRLTRALRVLARRHALATPSGHAPALYLTEFGYHANSRTIGERQRASFTIQAFNAAARNRHVREIVWFQLGAPPPTGRRQWNTSLLRRDGRPLPTFTALKRWIDGAVRRGLVAAAR
jgi:hypothetical protein